MLCGRPARRHDPRCGRPATIRASAGSWRWPDGRRDRGRAGRGGSNRHAVGRRHPRLGSRGARGGEHAPGYAYGWTTAAFSPAGDRLVTGGNRLRCAQRRALRAHARLTVQRVGRGQPAAPLLVALVDGAFVELQPMGLRVWNSCDGQLRVEDRAGRSHTRDQFIASIRAAATTRSACSCCRIGKLVYPLAPPMAATLWSRISFFARRVRDALGFTDDGAQLWWQCRRCARADRAGREGLFGAAPRLCCELTRRSATPPADRQVAQTACSRNGMISGRRHATTPRSSPRTTAARSPRVAVTTSSKLESDQILRSPASSSPP